MGYDVASLRLEVDSSGLRTGVKDMKSFEAQAGKTSKAASGAAAAVKGFAAAAAAVGVGAALGKAIQKSHDFNKALTEVSTLIEGTPKQMEAYRKEALRLSNLYGGDLTTNTKAFYQALSAGAKDLAEASDIVATANKLAKGGMTDLFTATDGLTSSMNAYAEAGLTAAAASDALFVGMRQGKTTIGELAGSLGRVAPLAYQAGLSFDELVAAVSTITKGGVQTSEAVSGVKAALDNIIKPSAQAAELADRLGLEFNSTALATKGLQGFLEDLRVATGGSVDALSTLFGSTEGAVAVMSLAGAGFQDLTATLGQMNAKLGETDRAVGKVAASMSDRLQVAQTRLQNFGLSIGDIGLAAQVHLAETAVNAIEAFNGALKGAGNESSAAQGLIAKFVEFAGPKFAELAVSGAEAINSINSILRGDFKAALAEALAAVENFSLGAQGAMQKSAQAIGASIGAFIKRAWNGELRNAQPEFISGAQAIGMGLPTAINNGMNQNWNELQRGLHNFAEKVESQSRGDFAAAGAAAGKAFTAAASTEVAKAHDYFVRVGSGMTAGMAHGVESGGAKFVKVVKETVNEAVGVAESELGIQSPSRVFRKIGEQSMEGFAIGIKDGARANDAITRHTDGMIDAYTNAFDEIERMAYGRSGNLNQALTGGANSPSFWEGFKVGAVNAWTDVLTQAFAPGGRGAKALAEGFAKVMESPLAGIMAQFNAGIQRLSPFGTMITPSGTFRNTGGGLGSFGYQNMWRALDRTSLMKDYFANLAPSYELIGQGFNGQLGGKEAIRMWREYIQTTYKKDVRSGGVTPSNSRRTPSRSSSSRSASPNGRTIAAMGLTGGLGGIGVIPGSTNLPIPGGNLPTPGQVFPDDEDTGGGDTGGGPIGDPGGDGGIGGGGGTGGGGGSVPDGLVPVRVRVRQSKYSRNLTKLMKSITRDIRGTVASYAEALGVSGENLAKVVHKFKIDLGKGTIDEKEVEEAFGKTLTEYTDALAANILDNKKSLQRAGEGWMDTLDRLVNDFWSIQSSMKLLGGQSFNQSVWGANLASKLVEQFGGSDAYNDAASRYFGVAYSEAEQKNQIRKYLRDALAEQGITGMPSTRGEYRDLVEAQNLKTVAGRERYQMLMTLADMFDAVLPDWASDPSIPGTVEDVTESLAAAYQTVTKSLTELVNTTYSASYRFEALAESLTSSAEAVRSMGRSETQTLDVLQNRFNALYSSALGGDAEAMSQIGDVATSLARARGSRAGSRSEYSYITGSIAAKLDQLSGVALSEAGTTAYEAASLEALLKAVDNGTLSNDLAQQTILAVGSLEDALLDGLREIYRGQTGDAPAFATGGMHRGGLRVVGERGPELEATGPARIYSSTQTRSMLGIDELRRQMARQHEETRTLRLRMEKHERRTFQILDDWNNNGMPAERAS